MRITFYNRVDFGKKGHIFSKVKITSITFLTLIFTLGDKKDHFYKITTQCVDVPVFLHEA